MAETVAPIPFNRPSLVGRELEYIAEAVRSGHVSGDGPFTLRCQQFLEERLGIAKVLMTPSCTAALELAAMLCGLQPGDEVIMPSYTFVSTANAVVRLGATPVFVDICAETLNLDAALIERAITPQTKAIIPVHYAGVGCDMDRIMDLALAYRLWVIEDAAQGVNASYRGRALGSLGHLGCYSFHETKNVICGEGGALCINDARLIERAEILRDKGTNRKQFFQGLVDKYTWVDVGSSYAPSEICCAYLMAQLEQLDRIGAQRRTVYERYRQGLAAGEHHDRLRLPTVPADRQTNHHLFHVVFPSAAERNAALQHLRTRDILSVFHFVPLHNAPMARTLGLPPVELPVTEEISACLLRLPMYFALTGLDQSRVVESLNEWLFDRTNDRELPVPAPVEHALATP